MADFAQERTEEATPRRRQQARRKGTVAKSPELTGAIVIVALLAVLPSVISGLGLAFMGSLRGSWLHMPVGIDSRTATSYMYDAMRGPVAALVPLVGVALVAGLACNFAQVGFGGSLEALAPSLAKLNPLEGFKRMFSARAGMEGLKAAAKTLLFGFIAYGSIKAHFAELTVLGWASPMIAISVVGQIIHSIALKVAFAWLVMAGFDYFFQKQQVNKQLRMTKEELKQEMKEMEQSPELKAAISQRRRRLSKRMMQAVKTADAIITNPTHYAVAIKYDVGKMHAPQVVAKGADLIAAKIREIGAENRVPLVPNPPLARQLYKKCEVGDFVPRELFQAVAEVLAYVYKTVRQFNRTA